MTRQHIGKKYNATGTVGRAPQRPTCGTGHSFVVRGESVSRLTVGSRPVVELVFSGLLPRGLRHGAKDVGQAFVTAYGYAQPPRIGMSQHGELLFFLLKKQLMDLSELVEFGPCVSAERVKACALIGLHVMAEENFLRSDSGSSPDLGETWRYGCPKSLVWSSNEWTESEDASSLEYYEHNVDNLALESRWAELVK